MDVDDGTVQLSPLHGRSPLLLHEEDVLVAAASFIDARRDSSWHSHLFVDINCWNFPSARSRRIQIIKYLHSSGCT